LPAGEPCGLSETRSADHGRCGGECCFAGCVASCWSSWGSNWGGLKISRAAGMA
jgi:hypothetical protein